MASFTTVEYNRHMLELINITWKRKIHCYLIPCNTKYGKHIKIYELVNI